MSSTSVDGALPCFTPYGNLVLTNTYFNIGNDGAWLLVHYFQLCIFFWVYFSCVSCSGCLHKWYYTHPTGNHLLIHNFCYSCKQSTNILVAVQGVKYVTNRKLKHCHIHNKSCSNKLVSSIFFPYTRFPRILLQSFWRRPITILMSSLYTRLHHGKESCSGCAKPVGRESLKACSSCRWVHLTCSEVITLLLIIENLYTYPQARKVLQ